MKYIRQYLHAFFVAFTFLTNLKIPFYKDTHLSEEIIQKSILFYPAIGLIYGLIIYLIAVVSLTVYQLDTKYVILIVISMPLIINKFLHFDGLMDSLDACLANKTKEERLNILKDSHIGSFALGSAIIFFGLKFLLIYDFLQSQGLLFYLIIIPVFSRFLVVLLSYKSHYPRKTGSGSFIIGKISTSLMIQTIIITSIILTIWSIYFHIQLLMVLMLMIAIAIFFIICRLYATRKIGGITGDILGASLELSEVLMFIILLLIRGKLGIC